MNDDDLGSLQVPVQTLDLLLVLTAVLLVLVAPVPADPALLQNVDLPSARHGRPAIAALIVVPRRTENEWRYVDANGAVLAAEAVARRASIERRGVVLLVAKDTPVQAYVAAREALMREGAELPVALGVRKSEVHP